MFKRGVTRAIMCILLLGLACNLPLVAQKLHNEQRDKLAQQIKSDFEQLTSPDGSVFEQAIKNAEATNDADITQWRDRERTLINSVATTIPFMTWEELQTLAFTARNQILDVSKDPDAKTNVALSDVAGQLNAVQKEEKAIQEKLKPFDEADKDPLPTVKQIEDALKKTLDDGNPLDLNTLQDKISALPDGFSNLKKIVAGLQPQGLNKLMLQTKLLMLQNEEARLQLRQTHFKERQTKLKDFESHVAKYAGGANKIQQQKDLEDALKGELPNAIKELDEGQLKKVLEDEKKIKDELEKELKEPIKTCADLNKACQDQTRKELLTDAFGSFWPVVGEFCKSSYTPNQTIVTWMRNLAQRPATARSEKDEFCPANRSQTSEAPVDPEQKLVNVLIKLNQALGLLAVRYDLLVEQTNLSEDELIFHIRMMQLNAQEHEVLLHSGITGLATYEAGGIKPQDVANIINMAQALATAAIAARVK